MRSEYTYKVMVPMKADPHIAGRIHSKKIRSASAEVQPVLLSTSLSSILSSIVVVSMASKKDAYHDPGRALLLSPFLRAIRKHNARS